MHQKYKPFQDSPSKIVPTFINLNYATIARSNFLSALLILIQTFCQNFIEKSRKNNANLNIVDIGFVHK